MADVIMADLYRLAPALNTAIPNNLSSSLY